MAVSSVVIAKSLELVVDWLATEMLTRLTARFFRAWAKWRLKKKIKAGLEATIAETHAHFGQLDVFTAIEKLAPVLLTEVRKMVNTNQPLDAGSIGNALSKGARALVNPRDAGRLFIDRLEYHLFQIPELREALTLRYAYMAHKTSESVLERINHLPNLPNQTPVPLSDAKQAIVHSAFVDASPSLLEWPTKLPNGKWLERSELQTIIAKIESNVKSATILLGPVGSGKSALLAALGNHFKDVQGTEVVAIRADQLAPSIATDESLGIALGLDGGATETIARLAVTKRVVLLIDQLDAVADLVDLRSGRLTVLIDLINRFSETPNVHIIASSRTFEFRHDPRFARLQKDEINLALPSWNDVHPILDELGVQSNSWPEDRREILRTPLVLAIFLDLLDRLGTSDRIAVSYQGMLDQIWEERLPDDQMRSFISTIAIDMANEECLSLPLARYEAKLSTLNQACVAGILRREPDGLRFSFRHQTLFDHAVARGFVADAVSLSRYVEIHQETLFVRPRIWSVLTYLREAAPGQYQKELMAIWRRPGLRLHLSYLIIDFLGSRNVPRDFEVRVILECIATDDLAHKTARAVAGNEAWFNILKTNVLPELMTVFGGPRRGVAVVVLVGALPFASHQILSLINDDWAGDDALPSIFQVLQELPEWNDLAVKLAQPIATSDKIGDWGVCLLATVMGASRPEDAAAFAIARLRYRTDQLFAAESGKQPSPRSSVGDLLHSGTEWYELPAIARAAPQRFLAEATPWFLDVLARTSEEKAHDRYRSYYVFEEFTDNEEQPHESCIIAAVFVSLRELARKDSNTFITLVDQWRNSDIDLVHRMLARALAEIGTFHPELVTEYLLEDKRRLALGSNYPSRHTETRLLIRNVAQTKNRDCIDRLFEAIRMWQPRSRNKDDMTAEERRRSMQWDRSERLQLLSTFDYDVLTHDQRRFIDQERRALPGFTEESDRPQGLTMHQIVSRMSADQMERAKDKEIIKILLENPDDKTERAWGSHIGGSHELAHAFQDFAKKSPRRAMAIVDQLPVDRHELPASHCIAGIADSNELPNAEFFDFVRRQLDRGHRSHELIESFADGARKRAKRPEGLPDDVIALFRANLQDVVAAEPEESKQAEKGYARSILWGLGGAVLVPHGNYSLLSAIWWGYILREPNCGDSALDIFLEHLDCRERTGTWEHLVLFDLRYLHLCDRSKATQFINKLLKRFPSVLASSAGSFLIARACSWADEADIARWVDGIRNGSWRKGRQAFGELVALRRIVRSNEARWDTVISNLLANLLDDNDSERLGLAHAAANIWRESVYRATVNPWLIKLAKTSNGDIADALIDTFRVAPEPIPADSHTKALLVALHEAGIFRRTSHITFVVRALADITPLLPEQAYAIARDIVDAFGRDFRDHSKRLTLDAHELIHVALTLQRQEGFRSAGLTLFEDLLRLEAYGSEDILTELDDIRPSSSSRGQIRRLRRRRGRSKTA